MEHCAVATVGSEWVADCEWRGWAERIAEQRHCRPGRRKRAQVPVAHDSPSASTPSGSMPQRVQRAKHAVPFGTEHRSSRAHAAPGCPSLVHARHVAHSAGTIGACAACAIERPMSHRPQASVQAARSAEDEVRMGVSVAAAAALHLSKLTSHSTLARQSAGHWAHAADGALGVHAMQRAAHSAVRAGLHLHATTS
jgi:hypothetical protein